MRRYFAVIALAAIAAQGAGAQRVARPTVDTVNHHIVRVMNTGPSAWADTNGWKLVYERTVQPAEGSPGMLEKPTQLILLPDGRLIVAQRNPAQIKLYDVRGTFVRNIGREGEGPGEFRAPQMALYRDTLVVHDARLGRAALFTVAGTFVRQFLTGIHHDGPRISVDERGRLRVESSRPSVAVFQSQWVYFDLNGRRLDSLLPPGVAKVRNWDLHFANGGMGRTSVPFSPFNFYGFLRDGAVVYGGTDQYLLFMTRGGRDTMRIFGRSDVVAEPIPSMVRDSEFKSAVNSPELRAVASLGDLPHSYGLWSELAVDGNGYIWLGAGGSPAASRRFDVFDPSGTYLGAVPAAFPGLSFASWSGGRVAVLGHDENDLPRIRVFRIDRRGH